MPDDFTEINKLLSRIKEQTKGVAMSNNAFLDMCKDMENNPKVDDMALVNANAMIERQQMRIAELEAMTHMQEGSDLFGKLEAEVTRLTDLATAQEAKYQMLREDRDTLQEELMEGKDDKYRTMYYDLVRDYSDLKSQHDTFMEAHTAVLKDNHDMYCKELKRNHVGDDPSARTILLIVYAVATTFALVVAALDKWWVV